MKLRVEASKEKNIISFQPNGDWITPKCVHQLSMKSVSICVRGELYGIVCIKLHSKWGTRASESTKLNKNAFQ